MTLEAPLRPRAEYTPSFREALASASRIVDCDGQKLGLSQLFEMLYYMRRHREEDGSRHKVLDAFMSDGTWHRFNEAAWAWLGSRYDLTKSEVFQHGLALGGMDWFKFAVAEIDCEIAAFTDWECGAQMPNRTLAFIAVYDLDLGTMVPQCPVKHLLFENFSGFSL